LSPVKYPYNTQTAQVLLKVTALNTLYSTQIPLYRASIPTIFDVVEHIVSIEDIDTDLAQGDDGLVARIARTEVPGKRARFYYSFATKYCSWHNPKAFPIFDSRVYGYLCHLMTHDCIDTFRKNDLWDYQIFKKVIEGFQKRNRLEDFTFKDIDKFLYFQGAMHMRRKENKETEPIEAEAILVPVPELADETEWRRLGYGSPEEAEAQREKWTSSAGWGTVNKDGSVRMLDGENCVPSDVKPTD
jgi:hypothetical protein